MASAHPASLDFTNPNLLHLAVWPVPSAITPANRLRLRVHLANKVFTLMSLAALPVLPVQSARTTTKSHKLPPLPVPSVLVALTPIPLELPCASSAREAKS